jgi:D-3-phosphoglycerate dehydrogenase
LCTKNQDVPGGIGHVGSVLGRNGVNIANFSLGRAEGASHAVTLIETDDRVPEPVLAQLHDNPAVKLARTVEFGR